MGGLARSRAARVGERHLVNDRSITPRDDRRRVLDLVQESAPRISPDGRRVGYTHSELAKWKDNKRVTSKLTDHMGNIRSFESTKDDASIVFLAERAKPGPLKATEKAGDDDVVVVEGVNGQEKTTDQ